MLSFLVLWAGLAMAQVMPMVSGEAVAVDGDSLRIRGREVRLYGIDAPEIGQRCYRKKKPYRCGVASLRHLERQVRGQRVECRIKTTDGYGRAVAVCRAGGKSLNAAQVRSGHAIAYRRYSHDYVPQEVQARAEGAGIWAGEFVTPEQWRRGQ